MSVQPRIAHFICGDDRDVSFQAIAWIQAIMKLKFLHFYLFLAHFGGFYPRFTHFFRLLPWGQLTSLWLIHKICIGMQWRNRRGGGGEMGAVPPRLLTRKFLLMEKRGKEKRGKGWKLRGKEGNCNCKRKGGNGSRKSCKKWWGPFFFFFLLFTF